MFEYNLQNQPTQPNWLDLNRPPLDPTTPAVNGKSLLSKTDFGGMTASLFFQNPSDTTQPDYTRVKRIFKTHSQTSDSILLLSLSPLTVSLLFVDLYSSLISASRWSLLAIVNLCLFVIDLCSSFAMSLARLHLHLLNLSSSISLLSVTRSLYSLAATLPGHLCLRFASIANIAHSPSPIQIYDYLSLSVVQALKFDLSILCYLGL